MCRAFVFFTLLGLGLPVQAGLVFDAVVLEEKAHPAQETHESKFHFRVEGDRPVTIESLSSSCGCLSAVSDKKIYAPGERGEVTAVFKLGSFEGEVIKSLYVHSDDDTDRRRQLQVKLSIPKVFEFTPEMTTWTVGGEPLPKKIGIKINGDQPIEITRVTSSREKFVPALKEIEKGRHYEITLTPASTEAQMVGVLRITTNSEVARYNNKLAYFNVMRARPNRANPAATTPPVQAPVAPTAPNAAVK